MNSSNSKNTMVDISESNSESNSETNNNGVVTQEETTAKTKRTITPQIGAIIAARKARMNMNH
jgi:hypothetical protein